MLWFKLWKLRVLCSQQLLLVEATVPKQLKPTIWSSGVTNYQSNWKFQLAALTLPPRPDPKSLRLAVIQRLNQIQITQAELPGPLEEIKPIRCKKVESNHQQYSVFPTGTNFDIDKTCRKDLVLTCGLSQKQIGMQHLLESNDVRRHSKTV